MWKESTAAAVTLKAFEVAEEDEKEAVEEGLAGREDDDGAADVVDVVVPIRWYRCCGEKLVLPVETSSSSSSTSA